MRRPHETGFTLVEILVVLLIVSIMSGVVLINLPGTASTNDFDEEVRRLEVLLELARDEALVSSSEFGFRPDRDGFGRLSGYSFFIYDELNLTWTQLEQSPFQPRQLPAGINLQLLVENVDDDFRLDDEAQDFPPVMLLSSGETTPFDLVVYREPDLSVTLRGDGYNRIESIQDEQ